MGHIIWLRRSTLTSWTYCQEGEPISSLVFSNYADGLDLGEILASPGEGKQRSTEVRKRGTWLVLVIWLQLRLPVSSQPFSSFDRLQVGTKISTSFVWLGRPNLVLSTKQTNAIAMLGHVEGHWGARLCRVIGFRAGLTDVINIHKLFVHSICWSCGVVIPKS